MNSKNEITMAEERQNSDKHIEKRNHICPQCEKGFTRKAHVDRHLTIHFGKKSFVCSTCSKQFRDKFDLKRHTLIHYEQKPYECPTCRKRFTRKQSLTDHLNTHSGVKPYECPTCPQQFRNKSNLRKHILVHSKKKQEPSESEQNLQQSSLLIQNKIQNTKTLLCTYEIVKKEVDDDLEPNKPDLCFEVPTIKQELMTEEDLETPSCSYQTLNVKQEPTENADPACLNLCDDSYIKQETEQATKI